MTKCKACGKYADHRANKCERCGVKIEKKVRNDMKTWATAIAYYYHDEEYRIKMNVVSANSYGEAIDLAIKIYTDSIGKAMSAIEAVEIENKVD